MQLGSSHTKGTFAEGYFFPLASRAGNGNTGNLGLAPAVMEYEVEVTVAGTTLSVQLEESNDGSTWSSVGAAVSQNGAGVSASAQRTVYKKFFRFTYTQTGANYTFGIKGRTK